MASSYSELARAASDAQTCGWMTGTAQAVCGKPAKFRTAAGSTVNGLVCGVHRRSVISFGGRVEPLDTGPAVRVGQVWQDADKRGYGRRVRVVEVDATHAVVELFVGRGTGNDQAKPGRRTRIRLDRFRPTSTGYRLIQDVEVSDGD
jgi:hypothetical protein